MTQELPAEVRKRLSDHLDAVEKVLIDAGRTRQQRRAVVDDLESQILDMLATRTASPRLSDVEAVLNQIDPPSAYTEQASAAPGNARAGAVSGPACRSRSPRLSKVAWWSFVCVAASLANVLVQALVWCMMTPVRNGGRDNDFMFWVALSKLATLLGMGVGLIGTVLGWIGLVQIRESKGELRGSGWALFAGLFYPTVFIMVLLILLIQKLL